jgi:hypothetical protein
MADPKEPLFEYEFDSPLQPSPSAGNGPNAQVTYATVYTFVIWDHDKSETATYPRMATRETIARMRGKVNEDTAWVVEASSLDADGFYSDQSTRDPA